MPTPTPMAMAMAMAMPMPMPMDAPTFREPPGACEVRAAGDREAA